MADSVEVPSEGQPDMSDHERSMVEKSEGVSIKNEGESLPGGDKEKYTGEQVEEGQTPEWLDPKFKSVEEQAKAYKELEKKLGERKNNDSSDKDSSLDIPDNDSSEASEFSFEKYSQEFAENGELTEESYKELEKQGYNKDTVDQFIEGQMAKAELYRGKVLNMAGGEDTYEEMVNWARRNYSDEERSAYNEAVNSGDLVKAKFALDALRANFQSKHGRDPEKTISGDKTSGQGFDAFESEAEVVQAMSDPRYTKDPAYRAKVESKLGRSNLMAPSKK